MNANDQSSEDILRARFYDWLISNGAKFPKIKWPSMETASGIRGAIATETIATGEHMIEIPIHLMMSPPAAFADPKIGVEIKAVEDMLNGDLLLTVYIMHELRKGDKSFYSPFLSILPEPGNISEWNEEELAELQDKTLIIRARNRTHNIKTMYSRTISMLHQRYPDKFPKDEFTYERFKFSFNSVQARAFGRRIPWTAMVPFADCLNHSNVQTKYDYNIDNNQMFRLFPTGGNLYGKGCEVFNSYGRRPNENLLMDYGFAILDNEWDEVEFFLNLPEDDPTFELRYNALFLVGMHPNKMFRIQPSEIPFQALMFLRIALMDASLLQKVVDSVQPRSDTTAYGSSSRIPEPVSAGSSDSEGVAEELSSNTVTAVGGGTTTAISQNATATSGDTTTTTTAAGGRARTVRISEPPTPRHGDGKAWFGKIFSVELELKALGTLRALLLSILGEHSTSVAQDKAILAWLDALRRQGHQSEAASAQDERANRIITTDIEPLDILNEELRDTLLALSLETDKYWRLLSAVTYRLTRKHILVASLRRLDRIVSYFERISENSPVVAPLTDDALLTTTNSTSSNATTISNASSLTSLWEELVEDPEREAASNSSSSCDVQTHLLPEQYRATHPGARASGQDYYKRAVEYRWAATNPLQWPEL